jgi:hypothetical protein
VASASTSLLKHRSDVTAITSDFILDLVALRADYNNSLFSIERFGSGKNVADKGSAQNGVENFRNI